ncbi:MAG: hypothetical protein ACYDEX_13710 [Mobilitalea sp.]
MKIAIRIRRLRQRDEYGCIYIHLAAFPSFGMLRMNPSASRSTPIEYRRTHIHRYSLLVISVSDSILDVK